MIYIYKILEHTIIKVQKSDNAERAVEAIWPLSQLKSWEILWNFSLHKIHTNNKFLQETQVTNETRSQQPEVGILFL